MQNWGRKLHNLQPPELYKKLKIPYKSILIVSNLSFEITITIIGNLPLFIRTYNNNFPNNIINKNI
jgi:hypothetical protein